jgi:hypothetical protein
MPIVHPLSFVRALFVARVLLAAIPAESATYYIGAFTGSSPADTPSCGTGKGAAPNQPCATLGYWNKNRRSSLVAGDIVRLAPATYTDTGAAAGSGTHCILLDRFARNVTYEGRTASDGVLDNHSSVIIDMNGVSQTNYTGANPCLARGITSRHSCTTEVYNGVVVRDLQIRNAPQGGIDLCGTASNPPTGITLDRIRITGVKTGGSAMIGRFDNSFLNTDNNCQNGGRTVKNLTILDSEFDNNKGFPGGVLLACIDGATLERVSVHDICNLADCGVCASDASANGCDDMDGIGMAGAINVVIRDSEVTRVGEDGIDVGGHPVGKSHHVVIERTSAHNNPGANFKASGGRYLTIRNSYSWGKGTGFIEYSCSHHVKLHNNTFWNNGQAVQIYNYMTQSEVMNNIFGAVSGQYAVFVDKASTNTSNLWRNNAIINLNSNGYAIGEFAGESIDTPDCMGNNHSNPSQDCSLGFEPPPLPCPMGVTADPAILQDNTTGLSSFQSKGDAGQWFGNTTGESDRWGTPPQFVQMGAPNAVNLHLTAGDSVAANAGVAVSPAYDDFDKDGRPSGGAWDIGADELSNGAPSAPSLISVDPLP